MSTKYKYVPAGTLTDLSISISKVKPREGNPRINDEAARKLAELIKVHGFRDPIEVDSKMVVTAGHTRLKAAKILKMKYVPVILSGYKGNIAAMAYAITNNKAHEFSSWDENVLTRLMKAKDFTPKKLGMSFTETPFTFEFLDKPDLIKLFVISVVENGEAFFCKKLLVSPIAVGEFLLTIYGF